MVRELNVHVCVDSAVSLMAKLRESIMDYLMIRVCTHACTCTRSSGKHRKAFTRSMQRITSLDVWKFEKIITQPAAITHLLPAGHEEKIRS